MGQAASNQGHTTYPKLKGLEMTLAGTIPERSLESAQLYLNKLRAAAEGASEEIALHGTLSEQEKVALEPLMIEVNEAIDTLREAVGRAAGGRC
jgi:hypothetical protein